MEIPDYYRQHIGKPAIPKQPEPVEPIEPTIVYQGNGFILNKLQDWQDKTIYTLVGPVENGIQHNVIITAEQDMQFDTVIEYADWQIVALEQELKGCRLLKRGNKSLADGTPAYEAVFRWYPKDDLRIYQQQIFVLVNKTGYKLTASFTKKTRKTLGPKVERMMLSFKTNEKINKTNEVVERK